MKMNRFHVISLAQCLPYTDSTVLGGFGGGFWVFFFFFASSWYLLILYCMLVNFIYFLFGLQA